MYRDGDCLRWAGARQSEGQRPVVFWRGQRHLARRLLLELKGYDVRGKYVRGNALVCAHPESCMNIHHMSVAPGAHMLRAADVAQARLSRAKAAAVSKEAFAKIKMKDMPRIEKMRAQGASWAKIGEAFSTTAATAHRRYATYCRLHGKGWM